MRKALQFLLCLLLPLGAAAAGEEHILSYLSQEEGLSDNYINVILSDRQGFIWLGTNDGLDRYDGCHIRHLGFPYQEHGARYVKSLAEDAYGNIWVGTTTGLLKYDVREDKMQIVETEPTTNEKFTIISHMGLDGDGVLWMPCRSGMLGINTRDGTRQTLPHSLLSLCRDPKRSTLVLLTRDRELIVLKNGRTQPFPLSDRVREFIGESKPSDVFMAGHYLFLTSFNGDNLILDTRDEAIRKDRTFHEIKDVLEHSSGDIWLATRSGVFVLDSCLAVKHHYTKEKPHNHSLRETRTRCLCEDRYGGVWAGSYFEGAARFEKNIAQLQNWSADDIGGPDFKVREFTEDQQHFIWVGTDTRGLLRLDPGKQKLETPAFAQRGAKNILGLWAEEEHLWVGSLSNDLPTYRVDLQRQKSEVLMDGHKMAYTFCRDDRNRLWIGCQESFCAGREEQGAFIGEIELESKQVVRILRDRFGQIWVGTIPGEIWRYSSRGLFKYTIPNLYLLTDLFEDKNGRIWVATDGQGLARYDPVTDRFEDMRPNEQFPHRILKVSQDAQGLFWMTTPWQLLACHPDNLDILLSLDVKALRSGNFNYSSNFIASDGTLYAGTANGFISLHTEHLMQERTVPPVIVFSGLSVPGKRMDGQSNELRLPYKNNSFHLQVASLDYSALKTYKLLWRLDDEGDYAPPYDGNIHLQSLGAGKHRLEVRLVGPSGKDSISRTLTIHIAPPPLLSLPAMMAYLVVLSALMFILVHTTQRRVKKSMTRLQEEKTYQSRMQFLSSMAHEIRTPLSLILLPLESLWERLGASSQPDVVENLDIIRRNSLRLTVMVNELLDFQKLENYSYTVHPAPADLRAEVKQAESRFAASFREQQKELSLELPAEEIICLLDQNALARILDNLLSNALKYSFTRVVLSLRRQRKSALLSVENDGPVIPLDKRDGIFEPFVRYESGRDKIVEGTGLGLPTSRAFAQLLDGKLEMDRDASTNRFILTLPLAPENEPQQTADLKLFENTVLVAEDDADMNRVLCRVLQKHFNVLSAKDGEEAWARIDSEQMPQLIVSDVMMPKMDGLELCKKVKTTLSTCHIPVILLTARVSEASHLEGLEQGADAWLEKPVSPELLVTTVSSLLENRKRMRDFFTSSPDARSTDVSLPSLDVKFLRSIQDYTFAHLAEEIKVEDLAELVHISPSSLFRKMKALTGMTPLEYVMDVRLKKASEMLRDKSLPISDIGYTVGFNTPSFFTLKFKEKFKVTPREYRNHLLRG